MRDTKKQSDILTSSPLGSPPWGCRYPVGSVLFDKEENDPEMMSYPASHPVDLFGNNSDIRYLDRLVKLDHSEKPMIEKSALPERRSNNRSNNRSDQSLESCKSSERINIGDAEDLDLANRLQLALLNRTRSPEKPHIKFVRWDPAVISYGPQSFPSVESKPAIQNPKDIGLKDCIQTICSLEKNDRYKLRELLDALSKIDGDSPIFQTVSAIDSKVKLNPKAPEFRFPSTIRNSTPSENLQDQNTWSALPILKDPIWMRTPKSINLLRQPVRPIAQKIRTNESQSYCVPTQGVLPPIFQKSPGFREDETGRETKSVHPALAGPILEKFTAKYPLTGSLRAAPTSLAKGRLAAAIQQRLEYLLMQEREKKAVGGKENESFK